MSLDSSDTPEAASDADRSQPKVESVSDVFSSLMDSFGRVLFELDGDAAFTDSPILEAAYEQSTRLKVWGLQNRASAPNDAPESMGGLLKEKPEVEQLVFEVLREANASLTRILQRIEEDGVISLGGDSTLESDSDTSSSSDGSASPGLITYLKRTFENVGELYRLQSLLRKPRMKGKYLHSGHTHSDLPGYQQDYQHVRQKLHDWQKNLNSDPDDPDDQRGPESGAQPVCPSEPEDAPGVSQDSLIQRQETEEGSDELTDILCRRLAAANSKRRKQLKYWQAHPYHHTNTQHNTSATVNQNRPVQRVEAAKEITKTAITDNDASISERVGTTVHSFSSAPRSAVIISESYQVRDSIARTTYQPSVIGTAAGSVMRVPDIPRITPGEEATKCPYCQVPLSSEILTSRENWK